MPEPTPALFAVKTCSKCGQVKPAEAFLRRGLTCRECAKAYQAEHYRKNRARKLAYAAEYVKQNPPDPERRRESARQRYAANPDAARAKYTKWRANNPEKAAEINRRSGTRARAIAYDRPHEPYTLVDILARDGESCVLCGDQIDLHLTFPDPMSVSVEHLECLAWPDSAGDVLSNVSVSHRGCNLSRRNDPHPAAARKRAELLAAAQEEPTMPEPHAT